MATRPEPTIIGNCDGWSFIVGKKAMPNSPLHRMRGSLPRCNKILTHNLSTNYANSLVNNMWTNCGAAVNGYRTYRIVEADSTDMHSSTESELYSIEIGH